MWYDKNTSTRLNKLPKAVKSENGWLMNFDERDMSEIIEEGYVPLTDNVPTYDSAKKTISPSGIVVAGDGNSATIEYTVSDKSLDDLKAAKKSEVDAYYRREDLSHRQVTFNNHMIICRKKAMEGIARKAAAFTMTNSAALEPVTWYFDDGSIQDLLSDDLKALQLALEQRDQLLRDRRKEKYDAIDALTAADSIVVYDHTANWL